jgi:hypothetical protein
MKHLFIVLGLGLLAVNSFAQQIAFKRFEQNPIITPALLPGDDGKNINGPSLIKVPDWVHGRLGKYYLYFAHHQGDYIRLAYADDLRGPWKIYEQGSLKRSECPCKSHIASPDVHIDGKHKQIVMYFHCPGDKKGQQRTFRAVSDDGIRFRPDTTVLGAPYFRVFEWQGVTYAIARSGVLYRSSDGGSHFEKGHNPFDGIQNETNYLRHAAVKVHKGKLLVFYSKIGDKPEHIVLSELKLDGNWTTWKASPPVNVAEPTTEYEGVNLPIEVSQSGSFHGLIRQLRDPGFYEENGKWFALFRRR